MTIINNKIDQLQINIDQTSPEDERTAIMKALCASVRWFGYSKYHDTYQEKDQSNLVAIATLLENLIDTKTIK